MAFRKSPILSVLQFPHLKDGWIVSMSLSWRGANMWPFFHDQSLVTEALKQKPSQIFTEYLLCAGHNKWTGLMTTTKGRPPYPRLTDEDAEAERLSKLPAWPAVDPRFQLSQSCWPFGILTPFCMLPLISADSLAFSGDWTLFFKSAGAKSPPGLRAWANLRRGRWCPLWLQMVRIWVRSLAWTSASKRPKCHPPTSGGPHAHQAQWAHYVLLRMWPPAAPSLHLLATKTFHKVRWPHRRGSSES